MTRTRLGPSGMRALLGKHGVTLKRSLGQNFVVDPNTIDKIVRVSGVTAEDDVLEIGAGAGALTAALAEAARSVTAIEIDARMQPVLAELVGDIPAVSVVIADALDYSLGDLPVTALVANLPYNSAATIVLRTLETAPRIGSLTVMTQKEVGRRLAAGPGADAYGGTSVLVSFWGTAHVVGNVSRRAFWPVPNVDSVIVQIHRAAEQPCAASPLYEVVKAAFAHRRKTLRNALAERAGSVGAAEAWLQASGIDPGRRAEVLSLADFVRLAESVPAATGE